MTSSESDGEQTRSRKRSRTSNSAEDGGKDSKKARGRPRVDTQDATAADRRRTQIRLAQRAYRQRKESTISTLKQESTQLHSIIDQMNKTFLRFNEAALKSGLLQLNAGVARELKHATETFTALTKTASEFEIGDEEQIEGAEQGSEPTRITRRPQTVASPVQEAVEVGWGYSAMPDRTENGLPSIQPQTQPDNYFQSMPGAFAQAQNTSLVPRRQFTVGEIWDQSKNSAAQYQPPATAPQPSGTLPFGLVDLLNQQDAPYPPSNSQVFSVNVPTPNITPPVTRLPTPPLQLSLTNKTIAPIFTYSHDETTFARRLMRAALETGFQILSSATIRPSALSYVFKLSLPYLTLDQLRARFRMMLSRSVNEDLDFWETPFIHLGGAGTHYPRKDANGNIIPKKNNWTVMQVGPLERKMVRVQNVADGRSEYLTDMDLTGFEGEWFDAYDVQGYLEERWGCRLDPKSSYAECLIDDEEESLGYDLESRGASDDAGSSPGLTNSSIRSPTDSLGHNKPSTPPATTYPPSDAAFGLDMSYTVPSFPSNSADLSFDQSLGLDLVPSYDYCFSAGNAFGANLNLSLELMSEVEVVPRQKKKKLAWLEVDRLIDGIIQHGVCLGRAPGFRRKDVDMAVQKALVPAS